jgi:THO complex subunit 2
MIVHVVDASRYLTDLELDILTYSLIDALSDRRKRRVEENGTIIAPWLKSLATFCGTLFRRHVVDLEGILRYIFNQLVVDNSYDLVVLQDMISSMTGIKPVEDVTADQVDALGAGETVRREALMFEAVRVSTKSSQRLLDALRSSGLAAPLGILIGDMIRDSIFSDDTNELKVLGWLHDHVCVVSSFSISQYSLFQTVKTSLFTLL